MKKKSKNSILRFFKFIYLKLIRINDSPQKIAAGFGLGVFLGILPVTGPIAALFLALVLRLNRASALLGSILTNTWFSVLTFILSIKIGSAIMNLNWQETNRNWIRFLKDFSFLNLFKVSALKIILPIIIGYFIVALSVAFTLYLFTIIALICLKRSAQKRRGQVMNGLAKKLILFATLFLLSGCATYRFQHGKTPYDKGYLVSRDDRIILEYTIGKDNSVPGIKLAKERYNRRKKIVEDFYKKMGLIENHFSMVVWRPTIVFWKMVGGVFRLPFIALSDYRCEHNAKYKEKIRNLEARQDALEKARKDKLKDKLNEYIKGDLEKERLPEEGQSQEQITRPVSEKLVTAEEGTETALAQKENTPAYEATPAEPSPEKKSPAAAQSFSQAEGLKAVIIAKPTKGYSPLRVKFNGRSSGSTHGKIVSYHWDFGDGETSTKPKPFNTYWSTTYGSRYFTAVLTVKDEKGNLASSNIVIEVLTK